VAVEAETRPAPSAAGAPTTKPTKKAGDFEDFEDDIPF
jgi:hypothetical protein